MARTTAGRLRNVTSSAVRAQIGAGGFVDQLSDHRLALGDLSALSVNRDEYGLVERRDQERRKVFLGPTARVAGLAFLEAGVHRRLAVVRRVFALGRSLPCSPPDRPIPPPAARGRDPCSRELVADA